MHSLGTVVVHELDTLDVMFVAPNRHADDELVVPPSGLTEMSVAVRESPRRRGIERSLIGVAVIGKSHRCQHGDASQESVNSSGEEHVDG